MKPTDQTSETAADIDRDAEALKDKYGAWAETYAENRAEAAKLRGADDDAEHWARVEEEVEGTETEG